MLCLDIIGLLPNEISLYILSYCSYRDFLCFRLVSTRWQRLADDDSLWKPLCANKGWTLNHSVPLPFYPLNTLHADSIDEGMGDEEDYMPVDSPFYNMEDSGLIPESWSDPDSSDTAITPIHLSRLSNNTGPNAVPKPHDKHSTRLGSQYWDFNAPSRMSKRTTPDYRLLYFTHSALRKRFLTGSFHQSSLLPRSSLDSHDSAIYCLQLYTYPETGTQVLFTGSRDWTIREWDVSTGMPLRVIENVHVGSVLSLCARNGFLASAGSDGRTVLYDLVKNRLLKVVQDHRDSVLCVRFNDRFLVSCSKDRFIRVYRMPDLSSHYILTGHRAAVNAIAISDSHVISASGDKEVRIWDIETGKLLRIFDGHHTRGIASIVADYPVIVTGSSDQHIRYFDMRSGLGWSTSHLFDSQAMTPIPVPPLDKDECQLAKDPVCQKCGTKPRENTRKPSLLARTQCLHADLVRSVAMNAEYVVSGGYDCHIKVWCRKSGRMLADMTGGHLGRIYCVDFDGTKVVSCGEDQRICIWSFAHGLETSILNL